MRAVNARLMFYNAGFAIGWHRGLDHGYWHHHRH
jgi:hypothetical protein